MSYRRFSLLVDSTKYVFNELLEAEEDGRAIGHTEKEVLEYWCH
jgi:hypothetical protein